MIIIAAAIITDSQGRCLLVRKRGTEYFMQPGGKPEIGETPHAALIRELEEELNFSVSPEELVQVGRFTDAAANEPGHLVSADVFLIATNRVSFTPTMEIEEVIWFTPGQDRHIKLAPLTENHLLPLLTPSPRHSLPHRHRTGRDENCPRPPPRRYSANAVPQYVLRRQDERHAAEADER